MVAFRKNQNSFLIVGQGLAGSILAWQLLQRGCEVLIVDPGKKETTSRTAAGLINPVTGKRLVKTEGVENYLPRSIAFYRQLEVFFGQQFFYPKPLIRLFQNSEEEKQYLKRRKEPDYAGFIGEQLLANELPPQAVAPLGGFYQQQTGYLDTAPFLDRMRSFFESKGRFSVGEVNAESIKWESGKLVWQNRLFDRAIFCEGFHARKNNFFSWLPFQPAPGEIITAKSGVELPEEILSFGKWIVPLPSGRFKLGATWQWSPLDEQSAEIALTELKEAFFKLFPGAGELDVIERKVGVRPGTRDKMPFIGTHPALAQVSIFNGFGSKGSLMIPFYTDCFVNNLLEGKPLPPQVNIKRFESDYPAG